MSAQGFRRLIDSHQDTALSSPIIWMSRTYESCLPCQQFEDGPWLPDTSDPLYGMLVDKDAVLIVLASPVPSSVWHTVGTQRLLLLWNFAIYCWA